MKRNRKNCINFKPENSGYGDYWKLGECLINSKKRTIHHVKKYHLCKGVNCGHFESKQKDSFWKGRNLRDKYIDAERVAKGQSARNSCGY